MARPPRELTDTAAEQEIERKKQIEKMWRRTKREADEEAEVMAEYERLEQGMNKHQKEAEKVLKHARKSVAQFAQSEEEPTEVGRAMSA